MSEDTDAQTNKQKQPYNLHPLHLRIQISPSDFTISRQQSSQKNSRGLSDPRVKDHHSYLRALPDTVQVLWALSLLCHTIPPGEGGGADSCGGVLMARLSPILENISHDYVPVAVSVRQ